MKLDLTPEERSRLRSSGIKKADIPDHEVAFLSKQLNISSERAWELSALATFQRIHSIGYKFAKDLVGMGYFTLESIRDRSGAELLDEHERLVGYQTDPCVEDQFRRVVHYANTRNNNLSWFDFTAKRKVYRQKHGYPADRPEKHWTEIYR